MKKGSTRKNFKIFIAIGSLLLLLMAVFHGSGFVFVVDKMNESNASSFLKEIMPILFLQPSVQLLCLASFGLVSILLKEKARPILILVVLFTGLNSIFALYLEAYVPAAIMAASMGCFLLAMHYCKG